MVSFSIDRGAPAIVDVMDIAGRRIATIRDGFVPAGTRAVTWDGRAEDGRPAASGVYFIRLRSAGAQASQKVLLRR